MSQAPLHGKKVALVIACDQFRDEELFVPRTTLEDRGAETLIAASRLERSNGMLGKYADPQVLIKDLDAAKLDAVIVVGGMGSPEYLWNDRDLHNLLQNMQDKNKILAAICLSGAVLAKAGVLKGKKATVYETPESVAALKEGGAFFESVPVIKDGKIITANGPEAASDFALEIAEELSKILV
ncbi:MAG: DJ-1/PfpI family protein [Candidatus Obscuribacterales bacterium]|nr:DJ-1/PfpI family protein [Cyanobacteria bacterium HKST-UBA01]MCB9467626.1 DJ-1/PfpI family protein [Candidatus Obscuribacterales bacterium]